MGHKRVKGLAAEDDDFQEDGHDYEEDDDEGVGEGDEELTAEDREQLRAGTIKVKERLGPSVTATEKEIQDALWHYYYDVGQTVTYIKNKHQTLAAHQRKQMQQSRFDQAAMQASAQTSLKKANGEQKCPSFPQPEMSRMMLRLYSGRSLSAHSDVTLELENQADRIMPFNWHTIPTTACRKGQFSSYANEELAEAKAGFFWDISWSSVPANRLSKFTKVTSQPRGRLLGGSSKSSKLATLIAARKKQEEDKKANAAASAHTERAVSLLGRLGTRKENLPAGVAKQATSPPQPALKQKYQLGAQTDQPQTAVEENLPSPTKLAAPLTPLLPSQVPHGSPSMFAQAILGCKELQSDTTQSQSTPDRNRDRTFSLPFTVDQDYNKRNPFAGPSPDDVVLQAQSKAKHMKMEKGHVVETNGIARDVAALSIQETPKPKSKNLNVLEEFKRARIKKTASFVVVGHVDHGKSTLMGRLLYDLKIVDEKHIEKLRRDSKKIGKASFALAWVMDFGSDERERGVTIDVSTNYFETDKTKFTILDAPGHQDFVPNMISGASQADFAVLVIDSSTNSFESGLRGQTKEHALLVRSMGVQRIIVAVNKMDICDWSQERFTEIQQQTTAFLTQANYAPRNISFVPCAGLTGDNVVTPVGKAKAPWYSGPTLVQELDSAEPTKRTLERPLRMTIGSILSTNSPTSISGRLDAGSLQVGDTIKILPSGETATVKSIEADGEVSEWAVAGQMATLYLIDVDASHLRGGDIVCHPQHAVKNVKEFRTKLLTFEHVMPMFVDVHRGPLRASGSITKLLAILGKGSGEIVKKKPKVVQPGAVARVVVELESEMPLEQGNRIILRAEGHTVATGLIE